jgi:hypothetical protein
MRFHGKIQKKNLIFREKIFEFFFGYQRSTSYLGYACDNLGDLGPLVWEEIENAQTVVNPKLKFIYT